MFKIGDRVKIPHYCINYPNAVIIDINDQYIKLKFDKIITLSCPEGYVETTEVNFPLSDAKNWEKVEGDYSPE